jgi:predicted SAM-dependent methyltransferase
MIQIDIGCGGKKRNGFVGLDFSAADSVDHVLNLETDRFPFSDRSVDYVFSSHCLEHLGNPNNVWREISRVIKPGGTIEIWTPHVHHDDQWLIGHIAGWSSARWRHLAIEERHFYSKHFLAGGFWKWDKAYFCVGQKVRDRLEAAKIPVDFAVDHMVNIVSEWGCFFRYQASDPGEHEPMNEIIYGRSEARDDWDKLLASGT